MHNVEVSSVRPSVYKHVIKNNKLQFNSSNYALLSTGIDFHFVRVITPSQKSPTITMFVIAYLTHTNVWYLCDLPLDQIPHAHV